MPLTFRAIIVAFSLTTAILNVANKMSKHYVVESAPIEEVFASLVFTI